MKYAKLINGAIQYAPPKIKNSNGSITYNPKADVLAKLGYLPMIFTDMPEVQDGYIATSTWSEIDETITQVWKIVEDPYYYEATADEVVSALEAIF